MAEQLSSVLQEVWDAQAKSGFLLVDPGQALEVRTALDPATGVEFRFRWLPHRRLRSNTIELERRGILNPDRDETRLLRDGRDPSGNHCFLCPDNVAICHPTEVLVPIEAGSRRWLAGANFAWLGDDHFTLMSERHEDQLYSRSVLEAMLEIHEQTRGDFRIVFNGHGAGATILWHLHLQMTTDRMPVEGLIAGSESEYPVPLTRFLVARMGTEAVHSHISKWMKSDPEHHRVNVLVAGTEGEAVVYVVRRDTRRAIADDKGLMGGWEVAGDFPYSDPENRASFEKADLETARSALSQVRPFEL